MGHRRGFRRRQGEIARYLQADGSLLCQLMGRGASGEAGGVAGPRAGQPLYGAALMAQVHYLAWLTVNADEFALCRASGNM